MEPLPRLELGYHLDALMNGYRGLHLLQRFGKMVDRRVQVYGARTDAMMWNNADWTARARAALYIGINPFGKDG